MSLLDFLGGGAQMPGQMQKQAQWDQMNPLQRLLQPEIALPMAQQLLGQNGNMQNFGNALGAAGEGMAQQKIKAQTNQTGNWLRQQDPERYGGMLDNGFQPTQVLQMYMEDRKAQKAGGVEYGLNPIWGTDENGNPVMGTMGKDGSFKKVDTGGVKLESGVDRVDLGTQWGLLNKRTGQLEGYMPKDLAGAEAQKEIGTAQGKAAAAAPGDVQAGQNALDLVESLRMDPGRQTGTGISGKLGNWIPASPGYDFQTKVDQAKSGAFLSAIQQLRGMGALSNAEGDTATKAMTRMNTATSEGAFLSALDDYEKIVRQGMARAQQMGGNFGIEMPQQPAQPRRKFNPATGRIE